MASFQILHSAPWGDDVSTYRDLFAATNLIAHSKPVHQLSTSNINAGKDHVHIEDSLFGVNANSSSSLS